MKDAAKDFSSQEDGYDMMPCKLPGDVWVQIDLSLPSGSVQSFEDFAVQHHE